MKKDIRLYYYSSGVLHKTRIHKFESSEAAIKYIAKLRAQNVGRTRQYVVTEYTNIYESKILHIV